jgi:hypothetical protein
MKNTAKLALASLTLALAFTSAPLKASPGDITITKYIDRSSPTVASSESSAPASLTDLALTILSAIGSLL